MLPAGEHVRSVYLGAASPEDQGLLAGAAESTLFIDCSTIDVASSREVHAAEAAQGLAMLDAPVSGGVAGAEAPTPTLRSDARSLGKECGRTVRTRVSPD